MNAHARPTACFGMESKSGACMSGALHYCVGLHAFAHVGLHLCKAGVLACCVHGITDAYARLPMGAYGRSNASLCIRAWRKPHLSKRQAGFRSCLTQTGSKPTCRLRGAHGKPPMKHKGCLTRTPRQATEVGVEQRRDLSMER